MKMSRLTLPILVLLAFALMTACTAVYSSPSAYTEMKSDADTVLLMKFDEGQGAPADSSGNENKIQLYGGKFNPASSVCVTEFFVVTASPPSAGN